MILETSAPTFIAEGTQLKGDLVFVAAASVFGLVEGDIEQQSREWLQIGRGAWIKGSVKSEGSLKIEGKVEGDVTSKQRVEITASATVLGKISAPSVQVSAGAYVEGEVQVQRARVLSLQKQLS